VEPDIYDFPPHPSSCLTSLRLSLSTLTCAWLVTSTSCRPLIPLSTHIINGEKRTSSTTLEIINPATKEPCGFVPRATQTDVDAAIAAARAAFPGWAAMPWEERAASVAKLGDLLEQFGHELGTLLTQESGKPLKSHS
jgi:delta 1-pyrroline-5-carboxylate dehydrogenase